VRGPLSGGAALYGKKIENREIVTSGMRPPHAAVRLIQVLNRYSMSEKGGTE